MTCKIDLTCCNPGPCDHDPIPDMKKIQDLIQGWRDSAMFAAGGSDDHDEILQASGAVEAFDRVLNLLKGTWAPEMPDEELPSSDPKHSLNINTNLKVGA